MLKDSDRDRGKKNLISTSLVSTFIDYVAALNCFFCYLSVISNKFRELSVPTSRHFFLCWKKALLPIFGK